MRCDRLCDGARGGMGELGGAERRGGRPVAVGGVGGALDTRVREFEHGKLARLLRC